MTSSFLRYLIALTALAVASLAATNSARASYGEDTGSQDIVPTKVYMRPSGAPAKPTNPAMCPGYCEASRTYCLRDASNYTAACTSQFDTCLTSC